MKSLAEVVQWLRAELAQSLDRPIDEIDSAGSFARIGVDSGLATHLMIGLEDMLRVELDPDVVAELTTIDALAAYAFGLTQAPEAKR
jgi:acyl carrier protein